MERLICVRQPCDLDKKERPACRPLFSVMMVVMVMPRAGMLHVAVLSVAVLARMLRLQRHVRDTVLGKLGSHPLLHALPIPLTHHVHGGVIVLTVHAPYVQCLRPNTLK